MIDASFEQTVNGEVTARIADLELQAYMAWEFLLDISLCVEIDRLIMDAADLAFQTEALCPAAIAALQLKLVELAEELALDLQEFAPFGRKTSCSEVGCKRMVVLIAAALALKENEMDFLKTFARRFPQALAFSKTRIEGRSITIDKNSGQVIDFCA